MTTAQRNSGALRLMRWALMVMMFALASCQTVRHARLVKMNNAAMRLFEALVLGVVMCSCIVLHESDGTETSLALPAKPAHRTLVALGGKGAYIRPQRDGLPPAVLTWDNEDSFRRAANLPVYKAAWNGVESMAHSAESILKK